MSQFKYIVLPFQEYMSLKNVSQPADTNVEERFENELQNIASDKVSDPHMKMDQLQKLMGSYISKLHELSVKKSNNSVNPQLVNNSKKTSNFTEPSNNTTDTDVKASSQNNNTENNQWSKDVAPDIDMGPEPLPETIKQSEKMETKTKSDLKKKSGKSKVTPIRKQPERRAKVLMKPVSELRKNWLNI